MQAQQSKRFRARRLSRWSGDGVPSRRTLAMVPGLRLEAQHDRVEARRQRRAATRLRSLGQSRTTAAAIAAAIVALAAAGLAGLMLSGCSFDTRPGAALAQRHDATNLVHLIGSWQAPQGDGAAVTSPSQMAPDTGAPASYDGGINGNDDPGRTGPDSGTAALAGRGEAGTAAVLVGSGASGRAGDSSTATQSSDAAAAATTDAGAGDAGRWSLDATITNDAGEQFHVCRDRCNDGGWQCPNGIGGFTCSSSPACYCTGPAP